jgi:hypothetical protein
MTLSGEDGAREEEKPTDAIAVRHSDRNGGRRNQVPAGVRYGGAKDLERDAAHHFGCVMGREP